MAEAIFLLDGERILPTDLARGPWTPEAQHGGAPAALLGRAVERHEGGADMVVARLTVELLRPVPIAPLRIAARFSRPGKKVQIVEASLVVADGGTEVARATALRMRRGHVPIPEGAAATGTLPPPASGSESRPPWARPAGSPSCPQSGRGKRNQSQGLRHSRGQFHPGDQEYERYQRSARRPW